MIQIQNRFYDRSSEHTVTTADQILDESWEGGTKLDVINRRLRDAIAVLITNNKGFFNSIDVLRNKYPDPKVGDYAIVKSNGVWYICLCEEDGVWELTEQQWTPELPVDGFITEDDIKEFLKAEDLKTVGGKSLIKTSTETDIPLPSGGTSSDGYTLEEIEQYLEDYFVKRSSQEYPDTSHLVEADLAMYMTKAEYYNITNPIRFSISASPSYSEYDGNNKTITVSYTLQQGGTGIIPDSVQITAAGSTYNISNPKSTGSITFVVSDRGTYSISGVATKDNVRYTSSASTSIINPSYYGFSSATSQDISLSSLTKELWQSLPTSKTIVNPANGNYLWIITPLTLRTKNVTEGSIYVVATDPGFSYYIKMVYMGTKNGFNYYKSELSVNATSLTYYIK